MTRQEMLAEIRRLSPFYHAVQLPHGLVTHTPDLARREVERTRIADLGKYIWPALGDEFGSLAGLRVLDAACNCGGFSIEAARRGAERVLGIDFVDRYLEQARFIQRATGVEQVEFRKMRIEEIDPETVGGFDVTFLFDVLYHLENPVLAMRRLAAVTRRAILVETRLTRESFDSPVWIMNFLPAADPEARDASTSLWRERQIVQFCPNGRAVRDLLGYLGFSDVRRLELTGREARKIYPDKNQKLGLFMGIRPDGRQRSQTIDDRAD